MYMEIKDNKKVIFKSDKKEDVINNLMFYTFELARKNKTYRLKYNYNYSDLQTITIIEKYDELNKREIVFYNIPTKLGFLDTDTILK